MAEYTYQYPRRRVIRAVVKRLTRAAFEILSDFHVIGKENIPKEGPLLVVANHFSFLDPVAVISISPWPIEFVGGFRAPNAPDSISWLRKLWGYYPVFRGTGSRIFLRASQAVLEQEGIMAIFPEASSAIDLLRPPRPGAAFVASLTGARVLPIGLDGFTEMFPTLRRGRRARVTVRIGESFGPFSVTGRGRVRRRQLDKIGHQIMRRIAALLPEERRGYYSPDPEVRAAALEAADYPWSEEPET